MKPGRVLMAPVILQVPPICLASNRGYVDIINCLVREGVDLEKAAGDGWNPNTEAVFYFCSGSNKVPL